MFVSVVVFTLPFGTHSVQHCHALVLALLINGFDTCQVSTEGTAHYLCCHLTNDALVFLCDMPYTCRLFTKCAADVL